MWCFCPICSSVAPPDEVVEIEADVVLEGVVDGSVAQDLEDVEYSQKEKCKYVCSECGYTLEVEYE